MSNNLERAFVLLTILEKAASYPYIRDDAHRQLLDMNAECAKESAERKAEEEAKAAEEQAKADKANEDKAKQAEDEDEGAPLAKPSSPPVTDRASVSEPPIERRV